MIIVYAAAATSVDSEPLASDFSGILGLALPLNSVISQQIPPTTSSVPDGAVVASNLFSISPTYIAPSYRFISLTLTRPDGGASSVPSLLGIGRHPPTDVVPDPSKVQYSSLAAPPQAGTGSSPYFWQTLLNGINVYVDGVRKPVNVGSSATAVIDSGMPVILANQDIANGIYGAVGIGPGSDGQCELPFDVACACAPLLRPADRPRSADWVPCTTPLNISVSLDSRTDIPLHPLDLTYSGQAFAGSLTTPSSGSSLLTTGTTVSSASSNDMCLGLIQSYPPTSSLTGIADVILGVPFMRSVYTVMAYDPPDMNGAFPNATTGSSQVIRPRLGLLGLINPQTALDEFHTERVLNQPLPSPPGSGGSSGSGSGTANRGNVAVAGGKKISVGVEVLFGILGFLALLVAIFGTWWLVQRRRRQQQRREDLARSLYADEGAEDDNEKLMQREAIYMLARQSTINSRFGPSEDTLRAQKFEEYIKRRESDVLSERERIVSEYSADTMQTRVEVPPVPDKDGDGDGELGFLPPRQSHYGDETLVDRPHEHEQAIMEYPPSPMHTRTSTLTSDRELDVAVPLLAHTRADSSYDFNAGPPARSPLGMGRAASHARVGSFDERSPSPIAPPQRSVSGPRPMSTRRSSSSSSLSSVRRASGAPSGQPPLPVIPSAAPSETSAGHGS